MNNTKQKFLQSLTNNSEIKLNKIQVRVESEKTFIYYDSYLIMVINKKDNILTLINVLEHCDKVFILLDLFNCVLEYFNKGFVFNNNFNFYYESENNLVCFSDLEVLTMEINK